MEKVKRRTNKKSTDNDNTFVSEAGSQEVAESSNEPIKVFGAVPHDGLTGRQVRFVEELEKDGNGTQAALRAGYGGKEKRYASAANAAYNLLRNEKVVAYRKARAEVIYKSLGITPESITAKVYEVYNRCVQGEPVLVYDKESKEWVESGVWKFDAKSALKALQLLGESVGAFKKQIVVEGKISYEEFLKNGTVEFEY